MDAQVNAQAWNGIARDTAPAGGRVPDRLGWTAWPGTGPGAELLGDLDGATVAELGCGTGEHVAYLAQRGPRVVYGVDVAAEQIAQALGHFGHLPRIEWRIGDAAAVLATLPALDMCYSIFGALWYADPERLLPAVAVRLRPGGVLAFSANQPRPGQTSGVRVDNITLPAGRMWVIYYTFSGPQWRTLLQRHGFTDVDICQVAPPGEGAYRTLVVSARLREPCSTSERKQSLPAAADAAPGLPPIPMPACPPRQ
jgi:SAM-dependent methyltransferase